MAHSAAWKIALLSLAVTALGANACGGDDDGQAAMGGTTGFAGEAGALSQAGEGAAGAAQGGATQTGADVTTLTDAQILLTLDTLNAGEVNEAQAAEPNLSNADVIAFAKRMVTDHTSARKMVQSTATQLMLTPESSVVEQTLKDESDGHVAHFEMVSDALDGDYVGVELTGHAQALELLMTLEQAADAAALKDLITMLQATVQDHYDAAKTLQASL